jgi:hypothetical protein
MSNQSSAGKHAWLSIVLLVSVLSAAFVLPMQHATAQTDYYKKEFKWDYGGKHWTWSLSIPKVLYDDYKSVPVSMRTRNGLEGYGYLTSTNDYYLKALANKLNETSTMMKYNSYDKVSFVLAFVQSLPYTSDNVTTGNDEYPRFPVETLVDDGGDCEDTSILFATLTLIMGYGTVYLNPPDHYAVGILGKDIPGGYYWTYNGQKYYYCETTGNGFKIGELPDEYKNQTARIYPIRQSQQYTPNIQVLPPPDQQTPSATPYPDPTQQPAPVPSATDQTYDATTFGSLLDDQTIIVAVIGVIFVVGLVAAVTAKSSARAKRNQTIAPQPNVTQAPTFESTSQGKFCVLCGVKNPSEAVYCNKCGQKMP